MDDPALLCEQLMVNCEPLRSCLLLSCLASLRSSEYLGALGLRVITMVYNGACLSMSAVRFAIVGTHQFILVSVVQGGAPSDLFDEVFVIARLFPVHGGHFRVTLDSASHSFNNPQTNSSFGYFTLQSYFIAKKH